MHNDNIKWCWVFATVYFRPAAKNHREKLCEILHSHKAQYAIIILVVLDMIIVIAELLLDLRAIKGECRHNCCSVSVFCCSSAIYCICQMMNQLEVTLCICCTCSVKVKMKSRLRWFYPKFTFIFCLYYSWTWIFIRLLLGWRSEENRDQINLVKIILTWSIR